MLGGRGDQRHLRYSIIEGIGETKQLTEESIEEEGWEGSVATPPVVSAELTRVSCNTREVKIISTLYSLAHLVLQDHEVGAESISLQYQLLPVVSCLE